MAEAANANGDDEWNDFVRSFSRAFPQFHLKSIQEKEEEEEILTTSFQGEMNNFFSKMISNGHEFFEWLLNAISTAKKRIFLASLYIGNQGELERQLTNALFEAIQRGIQVTIVLDESRSQRSSSKALIEKLQALAVKKEFESFKLHLVSPHSRFPGSLGKLGEFLGVFHGKFYAIDNECCLTGANLSEEYFTSRVDRYLLLRNADWLIKWFSNKLLRLNEDEKDACFLGKDTLFIPLMQHYPRIMHEEQVLNWILTQRKWKESCLVSGYFNAPKWFPIPQETRIVTADLESNGFRGANGIARLIPQIYQCILQRIYLQERPKNEFRTWSLRPCDDDDEAKGGRKKNFILPVFHAKGLFVQGRGNLTLATWGSSNFNWRSLRRDVECQLVVATRNPLLQKMIESEFEGFLKNSKPFSPVKTNSFGISLISKIFRSFF